MRRDRNDFDEIASSHCLPEAQDHASHINDYSRDLRRAKWGSGLSLHSSNPEPLMSALGQKQTLQHVRAMSALPPKADIRLPLTVRHISWIGAARLGIHRHRASESTHRM